MTTDCDSADCESCKVDKALEILVEVHAASLHTETTTEGDEQLKVTQVTEAFAVAVKAVELAHHLLVHFIKMYPCEDKDEGSFH